MTDTSSAKARSPWPFVLAFIAGVLGIYWFQGGQGKPDVPAAAATGGFSKSYATGAVAGVIVHEARKETTGLTFTALDGSPADLSRWKGRVVLLNLWATWCAPCRKEMPDLADLQKQLGSADFEVVALSVDQKGGAASAAFLKEIGVEGLPVYADPTLKSLGTLQVIGLPATLLIDRNGKEAARILGLAKWNAPEAIAMIKALMAEKG